MARENGKVLWSQRRRVATRQEAWSDVVVYEVPFVCHDGVQSELHAAMWNALSKRLSTRGSIRGSSYGATSVSVTEVNWERRTVSVALSTGIGD